MVYCATIEACHAIFDMRRAQEWTTALTDWCERQPDIVFRGQCLVYRAELMRLHGDWTTAADEVQRARLVLAGPPVNPAIGEAHYEAAELHRLRAGSTRPSARTPRAAPSAVDSSRASPSSGSPRVGPPRPAA